MVHAAPAPQAGVMTIHASAIVVGEHGVLLRGPSGAGKSATALALIAAATRDGRFARLVADDRVMLRVAAGRLLVAPHPAIAGRIERRFIGIATITSETVAVARLVVDLVPPGREPPVRLPSTEACETEIGGVILPRLMLPAGFSGASEAILHRLREIAG